MSVVSSSDINDVLNAVSILNSGVGMDSLAERTLSSVSSLIPSSIMTAFDGFDSDGDYTGYYWYSPADTVPEQSISAFGQLVHEHPYYQEAILTRTQRIFRTSDYLPLTDFHRTELYNEFYRIFGGETQMAAAVRVSPSSLITCSFHRRRLDFSDIEVEKVRLFAPHLAAAFRNTQSLEKLRKEHRYLSSAVNRGIIVITTSLRIEFESDLARRWLLKYFDIFDANGLPSRLNQYVNENAKAAVDEEYHSPPEVLRFCSHGSELKISLMLDAPTGNAILIFEEKFETQREDFRIIGLTERQAEILYWISRGKSDKEIADLVGASARTVQKHVENIFSKMGVENRTAAVVTAYERIR